VTLAPDRLTHLASESSAGFIGTALTGLAVFGTFFEWVRRRVSAIGKGWTARADQLDAKIRAVVDSRPGEHAAIKAEVVAMIAHQEATTNAAFVRLETAHNESVRRLHARLDETPTKADLAEVQRTLSQLLIDGFRRA